jgi:hypothetical protein
LIVIDAVPEAKEALEGVVFLSRFAFAVAEDDDEPCLLKTWFVPLVFFIVIREREIDS